MNISPSILKKFSELKVYILKNKIPPSNKLEDFFNDKASKALLLEYDKFIPQEIRKKTGSYYTPIDIGYFLLNQSFAHHLKRIGIDIKINRDPIYITLGQSLKDKPKSELEKIIPKLYNLLNHLRILDPALGSGNILIFALEFLIMTYQILWQLVRIKEMPGLLKIEYKGFQKDWIEFVEPFEIHDFLLKHYISKNLYGIEIDSDAFAISKLRFISELRTHHFLTYTKELKNNNLTKLIPQIINTNTLTDKNLQKLKNTFDIIIGNPPYGNILSEKEKEIVKSFCDYQKEVSSVFINRCISYNRRNGCIAFITSYAITFHISLSNTRKNLLEHYETTKISTLDRDNCRVFKSMTQSVSFLFCFGKYSIEEDSSEGRILTSEMFRETPDFNKIVYNNVEQYLMGKKSMGVAFSEKHRLPKVGTHYELLDLLIQQPQQLRALIRTGSGFIWYRSSGNYWYNAWDRKPYDSSEIKKLYIDSEYKTFILCLINSQIFYIWLRIYGDGRHLNKDILLNMPIPDLLHIRKYSAELKNMSKKLMTSLFEVFNSKYKRFNTSQIKAVLDENDLILAELYNYPKDEKDKIINYILNYESSIHGGRAI